MRLRATRLSAIAAAVKTLFGNASLYLDFTTGVLDPRISFTRASTATRFNSAGVLETVAANMPRFDYDPVTLICKGWLIEEPRTNFIRNSTMMGAAAGVIGSGGRLPNYWTLGGSYASLTTSVVNLGIENGISYLDVRFSGTPTGPEVYLGFDAAIDVTAALAGQNWNASTYVKVVGGTLANILPSELYILAVSSNGTLVEAGKLDFVLPTAGSLAVNRFSTMRQLVNSGSVWINSRIDLNFFAGMPIDITLRIGLPQLELGAFVTSTIPTAGTQATRAGELALIVGPNFSSWYNQYEGTFFASYTLGADNSSIGVFGADDATTSNSIQMRYATGSQAQFTVSSNGVSQVNLAPSGYSAASSYKRAITYKQNSFNQAINGVLPNSEDTSGVLPLVTQSRLGNENSGNFLNGHIKCLAYFPRRLSNDELKSLTA